MNRILLDPSEIADPVTLAGARAAHIHGVLKPAPGGTIKIGVINAACGKAEVLATTPDTAQLRILDLDETPPAPWVDLLLALPRPRAMKRLWSQLACLGVRDIHLLNAAKVEKTYFASHVTDPEVYTPLLIDGLMQSGATALPRVHIHPRLGDFFNDTLPTLLADENTLPLIAHPGPATPLMECGDLSPLSLHQPKAAINRRTPYFPLLSIGPDGGWTPEELARFLDAGFQPFSLGERPLRTDTACVALLATLGYLQSIHHSSFIIHHS